MVALIILGILALIIVAILLIPVGVDIYFEDDVFRLSAKFAGILLQVFPRPPADESKPKKEKKPKKKKDEKPKDASEEKPKRQRRLNFTKEEILELIQTVLKGLGRFRRKLRVDRFLLHYTAAGRDPYNTAMTFGYVNAALDTLAPICAERFTVKDCSVWTAVDFTEDWMRLDFGLAMTIRIGQILGVGLSIGFGALKILLRNRRRLKQEALADGGDTPPDKGNPPTGGNENTEERKETTIQAEERMAANG